MCVKWGGLLPTITNNNKIDSWVFNFLTEKPKLNWSTWKKFISWIECVSTKTYIYLKHTCVPLSSITVMKQSVYLHNSAIWFWNKPGLPDAAVFRRFRGFQYTLAVFFAVLLFCGFCSGFPFFWRLLRFLLILSWKTGLFINVCLYTVKTLKRIITECHISICAFYTLD